MLIVGLILGARCLFLLCLFFFFKQKTAYEMRISDWSSDVCSSDLLLAEEVVDPEDLLLGEHRVEVGVEPPGALQVGAERLLHHDARSIDEQIGRASCRERVCQYV